jgi:hypothetical protein
MGVRGWLARRAVRATRVLVVEGGNAFERRVAVERAVHGRGWRLAESPASADALVVVGDLGPELRDVVERLWDAMPGPRARAEATVVDAEGALDDVAAALLDPARQSEDASTRAPEPDLARDHGDMDHEGMDHGDMDHGDMDHGGMDMAPGGIPLAGGSDEDRDGLEMDELPLRLGPVLPGWPAGLVIDVALHGDLVVKASARVLGSVAAGGDPESATPTVRAARHCDEAATVLDLCGWTEGAGLARSARDALLDRAGDDGRGALIDLRHRVEHSRLLRWSLREVGVVTEQHAADLDLPEAVVGDCRDRLLRLVDRAIAVAPTFPGVQAPPPAAEAESPVVPLHDWGRLIEGRDLVEARLVIATLGAPVAADTVVTGG